MWKLSCVKHEHGVEQLNINSAILNSVSINYIIFYLSGNDHYIVKNVFYIYFTHLVFQRSKRYRQVIDLITFTIFQWIFWKAIDVSSMTCQRQELWVRAIYMGALSNRPTSLFGSHID